MAENAAQTAKDADLPRPGEAIGPEPRRLYTFNDLIVPTEALLKNTVEDLLDKVVANDPNDSYTRRYILPAKESSMVHGSARSSARVVRCRGYYRLAVSIAAQEATATVTASAPIYVAPDSSRTPLRTAAINTTLRVVEDNGDWLKVEFQDPQTA